MEKAYKNLGYIFLLLIPMAILAFYKSYLVKSPLNNDRIDGYIHFHAVVAAMWVVLLISQPLLLRYKQFKAHRLLGKISYLIFGLLVLSFLPLIQRTYSDFASSINPIMDLLLLLIFYPLAIKNKKKVTVHMRYMIAVTLIFIGPTVARILSHYTSVGNYWGPLITWGCIPLILSGLIIWDKKNGRNYRPYLLALGGFTIYFVLVFINLKP
ncbi:hypothetical protein [Aegicerativicinus sediminis]